MERDYVMDEVALLLAKIRKSEDLIERAEAYFNEHHRDWSDGVALYFERFLERKREQVYFEQHLVEKMGWNIALDRYSTDTDI